MMYIVYIIQKQSSGRYYIGMTSDIDKRILSHNSGANKSTKSQGIWEVVYKEKYSTKKEAWIRERQIKSYKGGRAFKKLLQHGEVA